MVRTCAEDGEDRVAKHLCRSVLVVVQWVGCSRWIDTVKEYLRKRGQEVRQTWRMSGICEGA